jgi:hypothetical protein
MLPSSPSTTSDLAVTGVSAQWRTGCAAGQKLRNTRAHALKRAASSDPPVASPGL